MYRAVHIFTNCLISEGFDFVWLNKIIQVIVNILAICIADKKLINLSAQWDSYPDENLPLGSPLKSTKIQTKIAIYKTKNYPYHVSVIIIFVVNLCIC